MSGEQLTDFTFKVLYLFIVETIHTGFAMLILYQPLIIHFGEEQAISQFPAGTLDLFQLWASFSDLVKP